MSAPATSIVNTSDGERTGYLGKKQQILGTESINTCNANRSYTNRFAAYLCSSLVATFLREPGYDYICCELEFVHKIKMAYNREEVCGCGS